MSADRMERVNELIREVLSAHLQKTLELDESSLITITRVDTSHDLSHAKVFVTLFPDHKREELLEALQKKAKALRHVLSQETKFQRVPQLHFRTDQTEENAQHIEQILDTLK